MNDTRKKEDCLLSAQEADRLLACADGMSALLYLHVLRRGALDRSEAARALRTSQEEIRRAEENLRRLGLLTETALPLPSEELPEYTGQDIGQRMEADSAFEGVVTEAQRTLGRLLSSNDLRILFGIYDYFGLPAEVIVLLLHHCIETYQAKNGDGRMPTLHYIETEARHWASREIRSLEDAEEHIRREKLRQTDLEQLRLALQIRGRDFTPTERRYAESWLDMGFGVETLAIAYDRTVVGAGKLAWKYMDKIVRDWQSKGLFTPQAVEQGDARFGKKSAPSRQSAGGSDDQDLENMRRMVEHMTKGG